VSAGEILSVKIKTAFGDGTFVAQRVVAEEILSESYVVDVYASTTTSTFDGDDLVHTKAGVIFEVYGQKDSSSKQGVRAYHGVITHMEHLKTVIDEEKQLTHFFHFQLHSTFWMLKHGADHRIFQEQSAIDIIQTILRENGVSDFEIKASGGTSVREYCVQYGENHFDFVSRLLEEEGIGYYFTHTDSNHTMVLFDQNSSFTHIAQGSLAFLNVDADGAFIDRVFAFGKKSQVAPKAYKTIDYNYKTPHTQLLNSSSGPGFGKEIYEYPGLFQKSSDGHKLADQRMEEIEWFTKRVYGKTTCPSIAPGYTFTLKEHPIKEYNKEYVISYVRHEIISQADDQSTEGRESNLLTYTNSFEGFLKTIHYRPYRKTLKPRIYGSQTAFVTGAGTEVYGDPMARIKVKFHWDLRNPDDETSSLWIRVSQSLSGAAWGALYMPRIGMEVVVAFIDGDPDRPLVTGCVYNQAFMPPYSPQDKPHYMTLKSKTFDDDSGHNELRFSDDPGKEEIFLHGQYDMNTVIEHSRNEDINTGDDTLTIHKGDKMIHQKGKGTTYLTLIDKGDRTTNLKKGNFVIDVNGTILIKATKDITIQTPKNIIMKAGQNIMMKAGKNIMMKAGMNIQSKAGKNIQAKAGMNIQSKAGMNIQSKAGMNIQSKAGMNIQEKAGMNIQSKAGMNIQAKAGINIQSKAGMNIQEKAGMNIQEKAGMNIQEKAGIMIQTKGGMMIQMKSGLAFQAKAGVMMELKSGVLIKAEGGAMGMFKGAITKLGN